MTKASGVGERRKGRRIFNASGMMMRRRRMIRMRKRTC